MSTATLLKEAKTLSPAERLELIAALWEGMAEDESPLTPEMRTELDRRVADYRQNGDPGDTWANVRQRIERRGRQ
jgi:putative addiction module component (TIGR02574 family)